MSYENDSLDFLKEKGKFFMSKKNLETLTDRLEKWEREYDENYSTVPVFWLEDSTIRINIISSFEKNILNKYRYSVEELLAEKQAMELLRDNTNFISAGTFYLEVDLGSIIINSAKKTMFPAFKTEKDARKFISTIGQNRVKCALNGELCLDDIRYEFGCTYATGDEAIRWYESDKERIRREAHLEACGEEGYYDEDSEWIDLSGDNREKLKHHELFGLYEEDEESGDTEEEDEDISNELCKVGLVEHNEPYDDLEFLNDIGWTFVRKVQLNGLREKLKALREKSSNQLVFFLDENLKIDICEYYLDCESDGKYLTIESLLVELMKDEFCYDDGESKDDVPNQLDMSYVNYNKKGTWKNGKDAFKLFMKDREKFQLESDDMHLKYNREIIYLENIYGDRYYFDESFEEQLNKQ